MLYSWALRNLLSQMATSCKGYLMSSSDFHLRDEFELNHFYRHKPIDLCQNSWLPAINERKLFSKNTLSKTHMVIGKPLPTFDKCFHVPSKRNNDLHVEKRNYIHCICCSVIQQSFFQHKTAACWCIPRFSFAVAPTGYTRESRRSPSLQEVR